MTGPDTAKFKIRQKVWSALAPERCGFVLGIVYYETYITYKVTWDDQVDRENYEQELAGEKPLENVPAS